MRKCLYIIVLIVFIFSCEKKTNRKINEQDGTLSTSSDSAIPSSEDISDSLILEGNTYDSISIENIVVSGIKMGDSELKLKKILGVPDSIQQRINEFDDSKFQDFYYNSSIFYIANFKVSGFTSDILPIILNKDTIRIGDNSVRLKAAFPNSVRIGRDKTSFVKIRIGSSDEFLSFSISGSNKIQGYRTWIDL